MYIHMRYYHTREIHHLRKDLEGIRTLQSLHALKNDLTRRQQQNNKQQKE